MKKARIVERTYPDGRTRWVIQTRHWLFRSRWVDGWLDRCWLPGVTTSYSTLESARANLCWYDGTQTTERVIE